MDQSKSEDSVWPGLMPHWLRQPFTESLRRLYGRPWPLFLPVANSTPRNPFATSCQVSRCCGPRVPVLQNQLRSSEAAAWMGDRCVLGFAPALRLLRGQIMCTLQKFFGWDYKPRFATYQKRSNFNMQIKDPGIHARVLRLMEKPN